MSQPTTIDSPPPSPGPRSMKIMLKVADLFFWGYITLSTQSQTLSEMKSELFRDEFERDDPTALADGPEDISAISVWWEGDRERRTRIDDNNICGVLFLLHARQRNALDGDNGDLLVVEFDNYPVDI